MSRWNDLATESFLAAAADDLQYHVGRGGIVESITAEDDAAGVALVAHIRIGRGVLDVRRAGSSLITAYAELRDAVTEPVLVAAYHEYEASRAR